MDLSASNSNTLSTLVLTDDSALPETYAGAEKKSQTDSIIADNIFITDQESQTEDCNDECLCHITPIKALVFEIPKYALHTSVIPVSLKSPPLSDLPPPYQPPQFS